MKTMKKVRTVTIAALLIFAFSFAGNAQGMKYVKIKTSAQSDLCKTTIEKSIKGEKGNEEANLDLESKVVTVKYSEADSDYDKITKVITDLGYSADDKPASKDAYSKLPNGCKSDCSSKKTDCSKKCSGHNQ